MPGLPNLWRDRHARGVIIQILTVAGLFGLAAYLGFNAYMNLKLIGKDLDFGFLSEPAGYDINQHLIDYSSQDTHMRAMAVGVLNTLMIAVAGITVATIVGFVVGILRLSSNVLIRNIAYVYIEVMRNVPILLWILLVHGIVVDLLPRPQAAADIGGIAYLSNRGFYVPRPEFEPLFTLTALTFLSGIAGALWYRRHAKAVQARTGRILPVVWVTLSLIVAAPLAVFVVSGFPVVFDHPELKGFNFQGGVAVKPEFLALWLALSLYTAAFIAEIVRSGILAIDRGQSEAAAALGLRRNRVLRLIVVPQALRVIVPPLTSQFLNLTKNSSLAIAIGYMDIVATIGGITLNQTGREMECMMIVLLLYLGVSLIISAFMNWYNKRIKLIER